MSMRYGEALLSQGLVTDEQLLKALKAQVRRKLHRLYFLTDSSISFSSSTHHEGLQNNESMRVHPWRANYHGVRSAWNAERLRVALGSIFNRPVRTALSSEDMARFGLGADDGRVGAMLRSGAPSVDALSIDSGLPLQPVSALVYALYVAEALDDGSAVIPAVTPSPSPSRSGSTATTVPVMNPSAPPTFAHRDTRADEPRGRGARTDRDGARHRHRRCSTCSPCSARRRAMPRPSEIKTAYFEAARRPFPSRPSRGAGPRAAAPQTEQIFRRVSESAGHACSTTRAAPRTRPALDNPKSPKPRSPRRSRRSPRFKPRWPSSADSTSPQEERPRPGAARARGSHR